MANTNKIKQFVEPEIRRWLEDVHGVSFQESRLKLVTGNTHDVDALSADGSIAVDILSNRARTRSGNPNTGGIRKAETDFWRMAAIDDERIKVRKMIFNDQQFMLAVRGRVGDPSAVGIEFEYKALSQSTQRILEDVLDAASREQRNKLDKS